MFIKRIAANFAFTCNLSLGSDAVIYIFLTCLLTVLATVSNLLQTVAVQVLSRTLLTRLGETGSGYPLMSMIVMDPCYLY
jgi:hypothetical protein